MLKNLKSKAKIHYFSFLNDMIFFLGKQKIKLEKEENKSSLNLEDLTPFLSDNDNKEISETYLDSLKWGILNNKVKNIAISGSFGTGKSTIINLFKHKNPEFKTIDVNLGKFEEKNTQTETDIETSIVQQILYFEKKGELKESRFERITVKKYVLLKAFFLIIWIYSILYLFFDNIYNKLLIFDFKFINYNLHEVSIKIIFIIISALIVKNVFNQIANLKLNKLSFNDAEFVPKADDISIINKHIDELLYFFEKTKTQIVFIEDIDRFEDAVDVFIKLRELNILINNSKDITEIVTFVYAVKDELFSKNNEKTKFFDLIIPIIPVIDYSNSNTQFLKKLRKDFIETNILSENIIFNISPYINDMRTLVNIINEFKVYHKIKTLKTKLDAEKLFGFIILKNIYPIDFKALQNNSGIVYNIFNNKNELLKTEIELNKKEIKKLYSEIENSKDERIDDVKTLRKIYIFEILKLFPNAKYILDNGITFYDLITDINFEKLIESPTIFYSTNASNWDYYKSDSGKTFKDIEMLVDSVFTYKERERFILNNNKNSEGDMKRKISQLESENLALEKKYFYELINYIEIERINEYFFKIIKQKISGTNENSENYNLLKVLLLNNYVNENYSEYISLFYPESLSLNDYNRKLEIIENKEQTFDSTIEDTHKLITELAINNFTKKAILNYSILDYLLIKNQSTTPDKSNTNKLNEFIKIICNDLDSRVLEFLNGYTVHVSDNSELLRLFVDEMSKWDLFWNTIYTKGNNDVQKIIFEELITSKNVETNKLITLNSQHTINSYLDQNDDFLINICDRIEPGELVSKLKKLGVKLTKIRYNKELFQVLTEIDKENIYKINQENVNLILEKLNNNEININSKKANYTYILKSDCENLKDNIEDNINEYIEQVILTGESNTEEEIKSVIKLLNNEDLSNENKFLLMKKLNFKIENIRDIQNKGLWNNLVSENKLIPNWENLLLEYENDVVGDFNYFKNYLSVEENYFELSQYKLNEQVQIINIDSSEEEEDEIKKTEIDIKTVKQFVLDIINSEISDSSFNNLIKSFVNRYDVAEIKRKERIPTLITNNLINFNSQNIVYLESNDRILLIQQNEDLLYENHQSYNEFDMNVWTDVFKSNINAQYKQDILKYLTEEKKYDEKNLNFIKTIINNFNNLKFHLYSEYFTIVALKSNLLNDEKIKFLNNEISDRYSNEEILEYIKLLPEPLRNIYYKEEFDIEYNLDNEKLIRELQVRKLLKASFSRKNEIVKVSYNQE